MTAHVLSNSQTVSGSAWLPVPPCSALVTSDAVLFWALIPIYLSTAFESAFCVVNRAKKSPLVGHSRVLLNIIYIHLFIFNHFVFCDASCFGALLRLAPTPIVRIIVRIAFAIHSLTVPSHTAGCCGRPLSFCEVERRERTRVGPKQRGPPD